MSHFDGNRFTTYTIEDGLSNNFVRSIFESPDRTFWIGTDGGGLNRFKDGHFRTYSERDGFSSRVLWSIDGDAAGTIWLGTDGGGLYRLRNSKFTNYGPRQGLPDDTFVRILDDQRGNLWLSSNKGIFSVEKKQFDDFDAGRIEKIAADNLWRARRHEEPRVQRRISAGGMAHQRRQALVSDRRGCVDSRSGAYCRRARFR